MLGSVGCFASSRSPGPSITLTIFFFDGVRNCSGWQGALPRLADDTVGVTERKTVVLVTGNSSWWKQRKYRREAARTLKSLRDHGWCCTGKLRLPQFGIETRRFTQYALVRRSSQESESLNGAP